MRHLAIARYRLLTSLRTGSWVFAVTAVVMILLLVASVAFLSWETSFESGSEVDLAATTKVALFSFALHLLALVTACGIFGRKRRSDRSVEDLMDTAPVSIEARFWGDALGIFGAVMTIHLCLLPLLAFTIAISPVPTAALPRMEGIIVACVALASTGTSWTMRAGATRWAATRTVRSAVTFAILFFITIVANTRFQEFQDAFGNFTIQPSPHTWHTVTSTVGDPLLLFTSLAVLYCSFVTFYYMHALHSARRG